MNFRRIYTFHGIYIHFSVIGFNSKFRPPPASFSPHFGRTLGMAIFEFYIQHKVKVAWSNKDLSTPVPCFHRVQTL